jgi:hypothetical protein
MERLVPHESSRPALPETVIEIERWLGRLTQREHKVVADLGRGLGARRPLLSARFGEVCELDHLDGCEQRFDAVVAFDSIRGPRLTDFDRTLVSIRRSLVEGGLLLATFPAAPKETIARAMLLDGGDGTPLPAVFHEIELQYRLQRAGLRGAAIRRAADRDDRQMLVCRAVRRADN